MLFLFGESTRARAEPCGTHTCPVCQSPQDFTHQKESRWFTFFAIPLIPIEEEAAYWRCENCFASFTPGDVSLPSQVEPVQLLIAYLLLGYGHAESAEIADEISLKLTGFELEPETFRALKHELARGSIDIVERVSNYAPRVGGIGKQQIVEAAFLTTYICCEMQYEDRLRVNLIGNALGVGLEFVDYAIAACRKQNYYGVRRLLATEPGV